MRAPAPAPERSRRSSWFAPFWRWHFYAGFLVVPVFAVLAATGLIYLFRFQLEPALHPSLMRVEPAQDGSLMPYAVQQQQVVERVGTDPALAGATLVSVTEPADPRSSTRFSLSLPDGSTRDVFVDPYDARVLGSLDPDTTLSGTAVRLHANLMTGWVGDAVIEVAVCWGIVLALTGYLLFVRGWKARRRVLRHARTAAGRPGGSTRLRDARLRQRHALGGAVLGVALLAVLVTGLPWTGVWGAQAQQLATRGGTSFWSDDPGAVSSPTSTLDESLPHSHSRDVPWALGGTERPTSGPAPSEDDERTVANVDTAVLVAARAGLARPLTVALPETEDGVFSVIGYAFGDPTAERTVHVGRFGGEVVSTYGYADYPVLAKVVAHGIALHEGRHLGTANMVGSAALCVLVLFMCVSGPLMWWRRRPRDGTLGAPRARLPLRTTPALVVALVALGVFLPLFGASLLLVLLADHLVLRRVPALSRWFAVRP
ncbi:PepSY-associated TM helix domain-containing protein [Microlunatus flavus]|uniref:Uncharacterized iron-regulated membrane protein n=1 Tax=Microlunatus flavus TaxID=1036181 RepID=A0A1H8Z6Z9_9ACTN|nr:PepSY domain-containing protein [Microlunatus flavus]SEP60101.1 Uncharacterized iron-regulated membrane protein [Microlunatus flavus]